MVFFLKSRKENFKQNTRYALTIGILARMIWYVYCIYMIWYVYCIYLYTQHSSAQAKCQCFACSIAYTQEIDEDKRKFHFWNKKKRRFSFECCIHSVTHIYDDDNHKDNWMGFIQSHMLCMRVIPVKYVKFDWGNKKSMYRIN